MTLQTAKAMPDAEESLEKAWRCKECGELMVCQVNFESFGSTYRLLQCPSCERRNVMKSDDNFVPVMLPEIHNHHGEDHRSVIRRPVEEAVLHRERRLSKRFQRQR